jgi:hypothetical protein
MAQAALWDYWEEDCGMPVSEKRFGELEDRVGVIEERTRQLDAVADALRAMEGGIKVLEFLGRIAKPFIYVAALSVAVYAFVKTGKWPAP